MLSLLSNFLSIIILVTSEDEMTVVAKDLLLKKKKYLSVLPINMIESFVFNKVSLLLNKITNL